MLFSDTSTELRHLFMLRTSYIFPLCLFGKFSFSYYFIYDTALSLIQ